MLTAPALRKTSGAEALFLEKTAGNAVYYCGWNRNGMRPKGSIFSKRQNNVYIFRITKIFNIKIIN